MRGPSGPSIQKRQTESNKDGVRPSGNFLEVAKSDSVDSPVPVRTFEGSEASEMNWPVGPSGNPAIARPSFAGLLVRIRRSEIRGPSGQSEIRGSSGQSEIRGPSGQSGIRGPSGQSEIRGPSGQYEIRGPSGQSEIRGPSGQSEIRGPSGSPAGRGEQGYENERGPAGPSGNPFGPEHPS
ncbi:collagen alpha-2(I) chain-like [Mercenaria mercenaria]|uniref:collagen alpha-2(I) chain-like n=1 Tax=Mercenaria mercenaria TaxID=6596 RepID=UPI00234E7618|nr:collagen alpha-2(I) chain-like [Mercenaria mercenaria]